MHTLPVGCPPLDALMEGGLESDAATLVFGEAGSGKTNYALQCAREALAAGKRVAYVDTEGVSPVRLEQVLGGADASRILFFTPFSIAEQERMVQKATLPQQLGLVVVDSINMHYRLHIDGDDAEKEAARSLYKQLHHLTTFARRAQVPVLVTGQVYGIEDATQPFARRVMEHLVKAVVRFEKRPDGSRRATLLKHRSIADGRQCLFSIGPEGLEPGNTRPGRPPVQGTAEAAVRQDRASATDEAIEGAPVDDAELGFATASAWRPAAEDPEAAGHDT